jgi:hypothetical protein
MYYTATILDLRIKCNLINKQYSDKATTVIQRIQEWLKKEYQRPLPPQLPSTNVELPLSASVHQLGLLRRACKSASGVVYDIDQYLNTLAIDWDKTDSSNYNTNWVLN